MLTCKILFPAHVRSRYLYGTFAFQIIYNLRNRILGWYRYQHVDMIGQMMPIKERTIPANYIYI